MRLQVGLGSCGIAAGGSQIFDILKDELDRQKINIPLEKTGCIGQCFQEPLVNVITENGNYVYGKVTPEIAVSIINEHISQNKPVAEYLVDAPGFEPSSFLEKQVKIVLRNCGAIDPESIDDYIEAGGYRALRKVLDEMSPEDVIEEMKSSGLRGRGGGGFLTGLKWQYGRAAQGDEKFVIVNGDEGDPGAFMDRSVMEGDPHSVLEGLIISAYAVGNCSQGYIYVREEYPLAIKHLKIAIEQARSRGFLGENILGSGFAFDVQVRRGAGAFVCGESTALMFSIEGKRGMPRLTPPRSVEAGLWAKPTVMNNVETFANVPWIIIEGASKYRQFGTKDSPGTKVFALAGKINSSGLIEVPTGVTVREIVFDVGGGVPEGRSFKAAQIGGPSGGCLPASLLDLPVDFDSLSDTGAMMGSGGLVVIDDSDCIVDVARYFLSFTQKESCGKCVPCRIGTKRMLEILTRITEGKAKDDDIESLKILSEDISEGSLCGLGQSAPSPVVTALRYFPEEFEAHVHDKRCPAKACKALVTYSVDEGNCTGCGLCKRVCPTEAISGAKKQPHIIDQSRCIHCAECYFACKFDAVTRE